MASERLRDFMNASIASFQAVARVTAEAESSREQTAMITINVATRRRDRDLNAEAVALEADAVIAWHGETRGHAGAILKSRADSYARRQGLGLEAITLGDLCEAIVAGGREGRSAARAVLEILGRAVEPAAVPDKAIPAALGDYVREHAEVTHAYLAGAPPEKILKELSEAEFEGEAFKALLIAQQKAVRS